jgi:predicted patatin/cPLA2 family phospholipase
MEDNLAIITSGGGMKSSYGVGVMLALAEKFEVKEPKILIACSGNAGTGSYYVSKQYDSIKNIWENLLSGKKMVDFKRFWKIIDIDYLIDEVFKKQDPLDSESVYSSPINYFIPALNRRTGKIDYFSNKHGDDVFEAMRATKAMPIAFKMNPHIKLRDSTYCDSCLSSSTEPHLEKAVNSGANKILIVNNAPKDRSRNLEHTIFNLWVSAQGKSFRENYNDEIKRVQNYNVPENIDVLTLEPKTTLDIKTLNNNQDLLRKTINQGYNETLSNQKLKKFLKI